MRTKMLPAGLLCAAAAWAMGGGLATAHTTADPDEAPAGQSLRTAFRVTHGCKGSPTTALTIRMPKGVIQAKPMPKPGWQIEIKTTPLDKPVAGMHGVTIKQAVTEVTWSGGRLENAQYDEFVLLISLPNQPGETLYFPTTQKCEVGTNNWTMIPAAGQSPHDLAEPAPFIRLRGGEDHQHHH